MKKLLNFLIISLLSFNAFSQSATVLPNSIAIPRVNVFPTCTSTERGNQIYYSPQNKMYYCNGSAWNEMSVGLPYDQSKSSVEALFTLENTGTGRAFVAKTNGNFAINGQSNSGQGVRGESISGIGVYGLSENSYGLGAYSVSNYGVYATSSTNTAAYFSNNSSTEATLRAINFGTGKAASFSGDVQISQDLAVNQAILVNYKGIITNSGATQLKYYKTSFNVGYTIGAFSTQITGEISLETFSGIPTVYVGNVDSQSGEYYKIIVTSVAVTTNTVRFRFYNASDSESTWAATYNIVAIGAK